MLSPNMNDGFTEKNPPSQKSSSKKIKKDDPTPIFEFKHPCSDQSVVQHLALDQFKVEQCHVSGNHNHKHCRYYHSMKDKRRKTNALYSPELCQHAETEKCPYGDECPDAHNKVERLYHIEKYKTKLCATFPKHLEKCEYGEYCSFAHSYKDIKIRLL